jgi:hypothetical protein
MIRGDADLRTIPSRALFEYISNHHSLKLTGSESGYRRLVEAQQIVEIQLYHPLTEFDKRGEAILKGGLSIKMSVPTDPWKLSTIHIEKLNQEDFQVAIETNPLDFHPSSPIVLTAEKYV